MKFTVESFMIFSTTDSNYLPEKTPNRTSISSVWQKKESSTPTP